MKIGISTETYDLDGAKALNNDPATDQKNNDGARRVSRTATLDGGCVIYDNGYTAADRKFLVRTPDDNGTIAAWAERIFKNYTSITLSTQNGIFKAAPSRWWIDGYYVNMEFLPTEEIHCEI